MISIRSNTFETNSSSTHAICISKTLPENFPYKYFNFRIGEYGWEESDAVASNYLYTAILCCFNKEDREDYLKYLKDTLDKHQIQYEFEEPKWYNDDEESGLCSGYIDHEDCLIPMLNDIRKDEALLLRYLFTASIYTHNDNTPENYAEEMYDALSCTNDCYFKGN